MESMDREKKIWKERNNERKEEIKIGLNFYET